MFKRKKTYIDKIDFDVFEDDQPEDFDLFSGESFEKKSDDEDVEEPKAAIDSAGEDRENGEPSESEKSETADVADDEPKEAAVNEEDKIDDSGVEESSEQEEAAVDEEDKIDDSGVEENSEPEEAAVDEEDNPEDSVIDEEENEEENEEADVYDEEESDAGSVDDEDDGYADDENDEDEKTGFTYDDFYDIDKEIKEKKKDKEGKKSGEKLVLFALIWILLFSAGVFAFLYFQTDLFKKKKTETTEQTTEITTIETTETTEELDEEFYTIYSYQTNADVNINALMADYYDALVKGDKEKLKDIVTEPEAFGDMVIYETKALVISEYSNITCYTIPGLNEGEILVFTTSNVTITGVNSKPLDIKQFYVVKDGNNYKINNGVLPQETIDYINVQAGSPDVQALYKSVQDNINQCLAEDSTFAEFYNMISTNTDAQEE